MTERLDPFCNFPEKTESPFDIQQLIEESDIALIPALGMMVPGYFLAITCEHVTSFSQLEPERLKKVDESLSRHEEFLEQRFGNYFRVEHGSDNIEACGSGGCIDHAHIHLIPDEEVAKHVSEALPWQQLESYEELARFRGNPYIYLGHLSTHFVVPSPQLPGQWIRRQIAEVKDYEIWDYALDRGDQNLFETLRRLNWFPRGSRFTIKNGNITVEWKTRQYPDLSGTIVPKNEFSTPDIPTTWW